MRRARSLVWLAALGCVGCTSAGDPPLPGSELIAEAGFVDIDPVVFELGDPLVELRAAPARMFYVFAPADQPSPDTPLCVLFNGGPGAGSGLLFSDLGPRGPGGSGVPNPARFTKLCHALFVDARNTGFSYLLTDPGAPHRFDASNYNPFLDAADVLRVVLRFVGTHPELADAPVLTVGESYGGVRATALLNLVFYQEEYAARRRPFRDGALAAELTSYDPNDLTRRFGQQLLLQPGFASDLQDEIAGQLFTAADSPVLEIARQRGTTFSVCATIPCSGYHSMLTFLERLNLSPYDYRAPASWLDEVLGTWQARVADLSGLETDFGVALGDVAGLSAAERTNAERVPMASGEPPDPPSFAARFGSIDPRDRYFIGWHEAVYDAFDVAGADVPSVAWQSSLFGELFLQNLPHARTFITRAAYDLVVYSKALPLVLERYPDVLGAALEDTPADTARPGELVVRFTSGAQPSRIRSPLYESSHAVAADQGELLAEDVAEWLEADPHLATPP